jgi:flagellar protein FliO/FliZ
MSALRDCPVTASSLFTSLLWPIVAAIPAALWLLKRTPAGGGPRRALMRTVAVLPLAPGQRLVTVEVGRGDDRRWLVLGVTASRASARCTDGAAGRSRPRRLRRAPACRLRNCCSGCSAPPGTVMCADRRLRLARAFGPVGTIGRSRCRFSADATGRPSAAAAGGPGPGGTSYSVPIQTLLFFTALSFLPACCC